MMENDSCNVCRFWNKAGARQSAVTGALDRMVASCRRRSPVLQIDGECDGAAFPSSASTQWCGEYEASAERIEAERREYRIDREANSLVSEARSVATGEARERDPTDWRVDWRAPLGRVSQRISREVPHLDGDIRDRAKALAACDEAVLELLNWAAVDTVLAEAVSR